MVWHLVHGVFLLHAQCPQDKLWILRDQAKVINEEVFVLILTIYIRS